MPESTSQPTAPVESAAAPPATPSTKEATAKRTTRSSSTARAIRNLFSGPRGGNSAEQTSFYGQIIARRMSERRMTHDEALDSVIDDLLWGKHGGGAKAGAAVRAQCRLIVADATELLTSSPAVDAAVLQRILEAANRIGELT